MVGCLATASLARARMRSSTQGCLARMPARCSASPGSEGSDRQPMRGALPPARLISVHRLCLAGPRRATQPRVGQRTQLSAHDRRIDHRDRTAEHPPHSVGDLATREPVHPDQRGEVRAILGPNAEALTPSDSPVSSPRPQAGHSSRRMRCSTTSGSITGNSPLLRRDRLDRGAARHR